MYETFVLRDQANLAFNNPASISSAVCNTARVFSLTSPDYSQFVITIITNISERSTSISAAMDVIYIMLLTLLFDFVHVYRLESPSESK